MSWFSSENNKTNKEQEGPARSDLVPPSWRNEKIENPFEDPKVRKRIADMIIRSVIKPNEFGA